jgi:hypothetical protein
VIEKTPFLTKEYKFNANSQKDHSISFVSNLTVSACQKILDNMPDDVLVNEGIYTLKLLKSFAGGS